MELNWKLRFKNKATLTALVATIVAVVYKCLTMFGIVPPVSENEIMEVVELVVYALVLMGIVVDPTTKGIGDSQRALGYNEPN